MGINGATEQSENLETFLDRNRELGRIKIISESEADGDLKSMYDEIADKRGGVSEVINIHSLLPKTMRDHMNLYMTLMFEQRHTGIKRKQLEMMAVTVSAVNQCS